MRQLFGLFLGALIGLWAGPVGIVFPLVAFWRGLPYRWGALIGYVVGLSGAMLLYASLDDLVFQEPEWAEEAIRNRMLGDDPPDLPPLPEDVPAPEGSPPEPKEAPPPPAWLIAIIPGALIASLGVAGAGWILSTSEDEDAVSDRH